MHKRMVWITRIINTSSVAFSNAVSDVYATGVKEPMPQAFNWRVVNALKVLHSWKAVRIDFRSICFPSSKIRAENSRCQTPYLNAV